MCTEQLQSGHSQPSRSLIALHLKISIQIPIPNSLYLSTKVSLMSVYVLITKICLIIKEGILKIHYDQCIMGGKNPVKIWYV